VLIWSTTSADRPQITVGECRAMIEATLVPQEPEPITATFGCRRSARTAVIGRPWSGGARSPSEQSVAARRAAHLTDPARRNGWFAAPAVRG
jgi:hypothetical protein